MHEFNLIQQYFSWPKPDDIAIAVGDDAAVFDIPPNKQLVTSVDTLISGVHFPKNTCASAIAYKALAVNLSDLAAMGASPKWFTLALTLPEIETKFLEEFSNSLKSLAQQHDCFLVGGDTTCGSLSISIQVMGLVDKGRALLRSGAKVGDKIYVTGTLGDAAYGLQNQDNVYAKKRLDYPTPRLAESAIIKDFATSCIDVSDGLLQDLSHVLKASNVGAELDLSALPLSDVLADINNKAALEFALAGGDDYELLFTIGAKQEAQFLNLIKDKAHCLGIINQQTNQIMDNNNNVLSAKGYNHFHVE